MKYHLATALAVGLATTASAQELNIYNWGGYTNPELIEKFEAETGIKVTLTDFDSNETALAKVRAGGHGFDMVVVSNGYVPIWIGEGLLMQSNPDQMENFGNVDPIWVNVDWDPGRTYTVPWQWGSTGIVVNTEFYDGDIDTSEIIFNPPEALRGKINVVPEMNDVINMATLYHGGRACSDDTDLLRQVRDTLTAAKDSWLSMSYGNIEKYTNNDVLAGLTWNGSAFRMREINENIQFGYPREGFPLWMDSIAVLADAQNPEEAKAFQNFVMDPENAALISAFARYANGILGSDAYMPEDMLSAREIIIPDDAKANGVFVPVCPPEVQTIHTAIWTELLK